MEIATALFSLTMAIPIKRHVRYILNRKKNLERFKKQAELLEDERERVKHKVDAAERSGETIEEDVRKWLVSVDEKIKEEAEKVRVLEDEAKEKCFIGLCLNFKSYYQLGKKAKEDAKVLAELLEQGRFDRVSYCPDPVGIGTMPNKDYEAFRSRASITEGIMKALRDPNLTMTGVYGMAGVGKTMLVEDVARKVKEEYLFDEVVMATISLDPNIRNIQGEIADMLGLRFDEESETGRAMPLRQRFQSKNDKKILVILDDIWESIDLEAIGIWFEEDKRQGSMMQNMDRSSFKNISTVRSKILLTSRSEDVLDQMNSERKFEIKILSEDEAMGLFRKIVGDTVEKPAYREIAKQVVEKAAGLPVAISVIAKALKNKGLYIWEDALRQLRRPNPRNIEGMHKGVYSTIELSYKSLQSDEARSLLQLCSWMPQGSRIYVPCLLRFSLALELLEDVNTLKEARNSVYALLDKLKASSLLLEDDGIEFVKMHDVIHDFCFFARSKDEQIVTEEAYLKELLKKGKLSNCKAIGLKFSHELPHMLDCPKLKLLALLSEDPLSKLEENFFKEMKELKALELVGMSFPSLPTSFLSLTKLETLFLNSCKLHDIAIIGELKKLDILTLCGSHIEQLPREIGQLTQLRSLDLSCCSQLVVIPENVLSSLTCLEELIISQSSFKRWDIEGNARLAELKCLCHLTTLDIHVPDVQILSEDLFSETLESYKIVLGEAWDRVEDHKCSRTLKLKLNQRINWDCGIKMLLRRTEDLYLNELKGFKSLLYELDDTGFLHLKHLYVQNNSEIQHIIDSNHGISGEAFPVLESLFLQNMINLKNICDDHIYVKCFRRLRIINVRNCDSLTNMFSFSLAAQLFQLQEIEVTDCSSIVDIVATDREDATDRIELRELRSMALQSLPELISFCFEEKKNSAPQHGQIDRTCISSPLFTEKIVFPKLEKLKLSSINIERVWHYQLPKGSYSVQNLTSLIIEGCGNLKHIFSYSMAECLQQLKCLEIIECKCVREIISSEEIIKEEHGKRAAISFPRLNSLKLKGLQKLVGFCPETCFLEFPSLDMLEIEHCPELKGFINNSRSKDISTGSSEVLFNEKVAFPNLEKMTISHLRNMKRIWYNQLHLDSFCKLKQLKVECCDELLNIFPSFLLGVFQRLEILTVADCVSLEEVFELQGLDIKETCVVPIQLRKLYLFRLPKLKHVWNKDPLGTISFQNLREVDVGDCWSLKSLFPFSIAKGLPQLEWLQVNCSGVEEIVSKNEGLEQEIWFEFNQLSSLILWNLQDLKCFYPGNHTIAWPMLKTLKSYQSEKLKLFEQLESQPVLQQQLFLIEKDKVVNPMFEKRPEQFGTGGDLPLKKDLTRSSLNWRSCH